MMKILAVVSALFGLTLGGFGLADWNFGTIFNGTGAIALAVVAYQVSDLKTRLMRVENHLMIGRKR